MAGIAYMLSVALAFLVGAAICEITHTRVVQGKARRKEPLLLDGEEQEMMRVLIAARNVQQFLWGEVDPSGYGWEEWLRVIRKRIIKLEELDLTFAHKNVEVRKRLLQLAAISIALLTRVQDPAFQWETTDRPSTQPKYSEPLS